jgi:hypothetical protein
MRAFQIKNFGDHPMLNEIPQPAPGVGQLRVRIAACALNFADLLMIKGRYQDRPEPPVTLGMELAGTVDAIGAGVTGFAPGTRVAVFSGQGGLADFGVFDAARCIALPDAMPFADAACIDRPEGPSSLPISVQTAGISRISGPGRAGFCDGGSLAPVLRHIPQRTAGLCQRLSTGFADVGQRSIVHAGKRAALPPCVMHLLQTHENAGFVSNTGRECPDAVLRRHDRIPLQILNDEGRFIISLDVMSEHILFFQ